MPLPPSLPSDISSGVILTNLTGSTVTIGAVDQGDPNAGGVLAWPVTDAPTHTALTTSNTNTLASATVEGTTADAAVITNTTGTLSSKLRGLVAILADVWDSANHFLKVSLATLIAGENQTFNRMMVAPTYLYSNITTTTTTVVKSGAGILHTLTFNKPVATCVVTIYDNTAASGTIIGTVTVPISPMPVTLVFDVAFSTGLTVVTGTAASDITVASL